MTENATAHAISVVLVEDHRGVRELLTQSLSDAGYLVLATAENLMQAHLSITRLRPRVAVLDNHLPDGRGIDLCRRLSREAPETAVVIYSGALSPHEEHEALAAGARAVLAKSVDVQPLLDAIRTHAGTPTG